jgi:hypothetical protein
VQLKKKKIHTKADQKTHLDERLYEFWSSRSVILFIVPPDSAVLLDEQVLAQAFLELRKNQYVNGKREGLRT